MNREEVLDRSDELRARGEHAKALALLDRAGDDADVAWRRLEALLGLGRKADAEKVFRALLRVEGDTPEAWARYAEAFRSRDDLIVAAAVYDTGLRTHAGAAELKLGRADVLRRRGESTEAERLAAEVIDRAQTDPELFARRAEMFRCWAMEPADGEEVVVGQMSARYSRRLLERALADLGCAVEAGATTRLRLRRADVLKNLGRYDEALVDYDTALAELPSDSPARDFLQEERSKCAAGPGGERERLAELLLSSLEDSGRDRTAAENMGDAAIRSVVDQIRAGADLNSALESFVSDDADSTVAVGVARSFLNLGTNPEPNYVPVDCGEFPKPAQTWARRVQSDLESQGFLVLGDFENVTLTPVIGKRVFMRLFLQAEGETVGAAYHVRLTWPGFLGWLLLFVTGKWKHPSVAELQTEFDDGTFVITNNIGSLAPFGFGEKIQQEAMRLGTLPQILLARHRERVANAVDNGARVRRVVNMEDLVGMEERQRLAKNAYRASIGHATEPELRQTLGAQYDRYADLVRAKLQVMASALQDAPRQGY